MIRKDLSSMGVINVHYEIQTAALASAGKGSHFDAVWHETLEKLLRYWHANIQMDLWDATNIMLCSAGYYFGEDWHDSHPSKNYDFWYKFEEDANNLLFPLAVNRRYIAFRMTIAIFETINYWCWYENPLNITFNKENLFRTLRYGNICIEWDKYQYNWELNNH